MEGEYLGEYVKDRGGEDSLSESDEEVEFIKKYSLAIHYINENGELVSRQVECESSKCSIWILQNIILVLADYGLYTFTKPGLEKSELKLIPQVYYKHGDIVQYLTAYFSPDNGVRFIYYTSDYTYVNAPPDLNEERGSIHLYQVPMGYSKKKDFNGCIIPYFHDDEDESIELRFGEDGHHFVCHSGNDNCFGYTSYKIVSGKRLRCKMFMDNFRQILAWRANSKYVVYVTEETLWARRTDDENGDAEAQYGFWPHSLDRSLDHECIDLQEIILTECHVFALFSIPYSHGNSQYVALTIDLETHEVKHAVGHERMEYPPQGIAKKPRTTSIYVDRPRVEYQAVNISRGNGAIKLNDGKIGVFSNIDGAGPLLLMDLASGDAERILNGRRVIKSAVENTESYVSAENITEVKPGLCLFEARGDFDNFTLELIAWKGEQLPKSFEKWSEWLEGRM